MNSDSSDKSKMGNGKSKRQSESSQPKEISKASQVSQQILQGDSSGLLLHLEAVQSLTASGRCTFSRIPLDAILSALHLVEGYIESANGVNLVMQQRTRFLKLYGRMGKYLLETRPNCRNITTEFPKDDTETPQPGSSTGLPEEMSLEEELRIIRAKELLERCPDFNLPSAPPEEQTPYNTMSSDSGPGGLTTPVRRSSSASTESGETAVNTSGMSLPEDSVRRFVNSLNRNLEQPIGREAADKWVSEAVEKGGVGAVTRVIPSAIWDHRTWRVVDVEDVVGKKTIMRKILVLDRNQNILPEVGGPSARNPDDGFDGNDRRAFKVIEVDPSFGDGSIKFVDHELYYHLSLELFGKPITTHSVDNLKQVSKRFLSKYKMSHLDGFAVSMMIKHTVLAAMIPSKDDLDNLQDLGKNRNVKNIQKMNDFIREGQVKKRRGLGFLPDKIRKVLPKE